LTALRTGNVAVTIRISVVLAMPGHQYQLELDVPEGTQARDAVRIAMEAGLIGFGPVDIDPLVAPLGVFSERVTDDEELKAGHRVEIYRPLQQDPKELRRQRARLK